MKLIHRLGGRKAWSQPPSWAYDDLQLAWSSAPTWGDKERIDGDFAGMVRGAYKRNGIVFALILTRMLVFSEARMMFRERNDGVLGDYHWTDALTLLDKPWPNGNTGDLLGRMLQDADLAGNAFIARRPGRLKRLRPDWVTIVLGSNGEPAESPWEIDAEVIGYMYEPGGRGSTQPATILTPGEVAHFAPIPDPDAQFRGMSWLTPVLRELEADQAATTHKLRFFESGASPKMVVSIDKDVTVEQFRKFKAVMDAEHKGVDKAYKTLYLAGGADVSVVGKDLRELDFRATQGAGETRIAAAAGVPPVIAGFSEGLQSATYSNYGQARRRMADGTMRPLWRSGAGSLASIVDVPVGEELAADVRDVAFLREDRKDVAEIQAKQAVTMRQLVDAGYSAESVTDAVLAEDWGLLTHTGLFSVQLQPPGTQFEPNTRNDADLPPSTQDEGKT